MGNEKKYEIKLLYLGKYLKEIENDKNLIINETKLPDSEFKKQLSEFGLVNKQKIESLNIKTIYNIYKKYEKEVNEIKIHENNDIIKDQKKLIENNNVIEDDKSLIINYLNNKNIIFGEININSEDINKDIQIINSYENFKKKYNIILKDDLKYNNEKEIKENRNKNRWKNN